MGKPHLLILAAAVLLVLAAVFVQIGKDEKAEQRRPAEADRPAPSAAEPSRAAKPGASGRERCRQKCSALHKGFVYRARQSTEAEYCGCV